MFESAIRPKPVEGCRYTGFNGRTGMHQFGSDTITTMRSVLEEVCIHIPRDSTAARSFIASRILECASKGERTHKGLLVAARRAVIDQFGTVAAARSAFGIYERGEL